MKKHPKTATVFNFTSNGGKRPPNSLNGLKTLFEIVVMFPTSSPDVKKGLILSIYSCSDMGNQEDYFARQTRRVSRREFHSFVRKAKRTTIQIHGPENGRHRAKLFIEQTASVEIDVWREARQRRNIHSGWVMRPCFCLFAPSLSVSFPVVHFRFQLCLLLN